MMAMRFIILSFTLMVFSSCFPPISDKTAIATLDYPVMSAGKIKTQLATIYLPYKKYLDLKALPEGPLRASQLVAKNPPAPAVLVLHGGFSGNDNATDQWALSLAEKGFVAVVPTYRGEPRNWDDKKADGKVEFCKGEADDVLALLTWLKSFPYIDAKRIGVMGFSHGACIALTVAARDSSLKAAVAVSPPVDTAYTYKHLRSHFYNWFGYAGILALQVRHYVGVSPEASRADWNVRSPLFGTHPFTMPLLIAHGTGDNLVPHHQTCAFQRRLAMEGYQIRQEVVPAFGYDAHKHLCHQPLVTSVDDKRPPISFLYFKNEDHIFTSKGNAILRNQVFQFLEQSLQNR